MASQTVQLRRGGYFVVHCKQVSGVPTPRIWRYGQPATYLTRPSASRGGVLSLARPSAPAERVQYSGGRLTFQGVHHVGLLCESLEKSLEFYCGVLGLTLNPDRPDSKLPYRGAWLWVGAEMIHLMELPNPDPTEGRPEHGGRDRHVCLSVASVDALEDQLKKADIPFTRSHSGRPAIFFRDPDSNAIECAESVTSR
ncbi:hypothetical protein WJX72_003370 [[Myrmecia] bisecta]|uniref:VOC domain-containing protein n=1 Tax=[Myrmecia] bisecta TaxID=41462 RepID=A0AAW1Q8K2_9CHLO